MTYQELHDLFYIEMDVVQNPYYTPDQVDVFLNQAQIEWFQDLSPNAETNEQLRELFGSLFRTVTLPGTLTVLESDLPDKANVTALSGVFELEGCGGDRVNRTRPIVPMAHDRYAFALSDPDEVPTNAFPAYLQTFTTELEYHIKCDTIPSQVTVDYIAYPPVIDGAGSPTTDLVLPIPVIYTILNIACRKASAVIEDAARYQMAAQETTLSQ